MSIISISSGNCGVALSSAVFECINQSINNKSTIDYANSIYDIYFKGDGKIFSRSIIIGSDISHFNEYKEAQGLFRGDGSSEKTPYYWSQNPSMIIEFNENSNNNWAKGYYQSQQQEELISDYINKECEESDTLDSFMIYGGFAGGTGSGGSSMISLILEDEYPKTCQVCVGVLPFSSGENAFQSMNTMLALTSLYDSCNSLILFENDRYDSICKNIYKRGDYSAMNDCMANSLLSNIQPIAETCKISRKTLYRNNVERMIRDLCLYPKLKLLTSRSLPMGSCNSSYESPTHCKLLSQIIESINESLLPFEINETNDPDVDVHFTTYTPTSIGDLGNYESKLYKSVSRIPIKAPYYTSARDGVLINSKRNLNFKSNLSNKKNDNVRVINTGEGRKKPVKKNVVTSMNINIGGELDCDGIDFKRHLSQVVFWNHSINPVKAYYIPWDGMGKKSCGILTNCQTPIKSITRSNDTMKMIFASNAYLYKYHSFGMDNDEFMNCIVKSDEIITSYNNL